MRSYASTKNVRNKFIKKTKKWFELTTSTIGDNVSTPQPEEPEDNFNRQMQDVTSPIPKYGKNDAGNRRNSRPLC